MTRFRHLSYADVAATLALVLALGGGGVAVAAGLGKNSVGSRQIKPAAVKRADLAPGAVDSSRIRDGAVTGTDVDESSLAKVPAAGTADTAGNVLSAMITSAGTISRGRGVVSVVRQGTGTYRVRFDRTVATCSYGGSPVDDGTGIPPVGIVSVAVDSQSNGAGLYVTTRDQDLAEADLEFSLLVIC